MVKQNPTPMQTLVQTVIDNTIQSDGEGSVDVGFFSVVRPLNSHLSKNDLREQILAAALGEFVTMTAEDWLRGPHYIHLGGWIGDQGLALRLIGLGALVGLWSVSLPSSLGITDEAETQKLLGQGFVYATGFHLD